MKASATIVKSALCRTNCFPRPNPTVFMFPGINNCKPVLDKSQFPAITRLLQDNFDAILGEYLELKKTGFENDYDSGDHKLHSGNWAWHSYLLKGERQASFASKCPKTTEIMEAFAQPKLMTGIPFSFAFFSVLGPNSSIDAHYGPVNLRLRCHFPLILPSQKDDKGEELCGMEIGGQRVQWKLGEPLFFDDSYHHRVWNHSGQERVVLLFDIWHPDLVVEEVDAVTDMFQYAKQQGWLGSGK